MLLAAALVLTVRVIAQGTSPSKPTAPIDICITDPIWVSDWKEFRKFVKKFKTKEYKFKFKKDDGTYELPDEGELAECTPPPVAVSAGARSTAASAVPPRPGGAQVTQHLRINTARDLTELLSSMDAASTPSPSATPKP